jgi:N-acetylglucosaminyldiphosphoundecaprenol N-acetyl-beta-D-mannosaminyltransferase
MIVLRVVLNETDYMSASNKIEEWTNCHESRYICIANVHLLMEANDSPDFAEIVNRADLVTPDGMPLVWMMRLKGVKNQQRVYGPTLMLHVLDAAARNQIPVGFYGGTPAVLEMLVYRMRSRFKSLRVAYAYSPSFRPTSLDEDAEVLRQINQSGACILFVGLGCPKQERWMAEHRGKVNAVMLGVGAAFDFHAGVKPQAPALLQRLGLEWFFRLITEPRRLWRRYLYHNPRFVVLAIADLLGFL